MLKKALLMFLSLILLSFIVSCKDNKNVQDDYVDLRILNNDDSAKEAILEHSNGNMAKGFVKLCKICGGCGNDNTEYVKVSEQMQIIRDKMY